MKRAVKRTTILVVLALAAWTLAQPAQADFHPGCEDGPKSATVELVADGGDLLFTGQVSCPAADAIAITALTFVAMDGSTSSAAPVSCTQCSSVATSGRAGASPGVHEVRMAFTVTGHDHTYNRTRSARWLYAGAGQPVQLAGG